MIKVSIPHYHYRNRRIGDYLKEYVGKSPEVDLEEFVAIKLASISLD
jgi:hypothetical protein